MAVKKTEKPEESGKSSGDGMSLEMQQKMMDQMAAMAAKIDDLEKRNTTSVTPDANVLQQLVMELRKSGTVEQLDNTGYLDPSLIDKDDILEEKDYVRFYAHVSGYVVVDDLRNGIPIRTPYGNKIEFKYFGSKSSGTGRFEEREHISSYTCKSKKEAEWLRGHTMFGVKFFESAGEETSIDGKKAVKMATMMNNLMAQDKHTIIEMCRANDIPMMEDAQKMRLALANKLTEGMINQEKKADEERIKEMILESEEFKKHQK